MKKIFTHVLVAAALLSSISVKAQYAQKERGHHMPDSIKVNHWLIHPIYGAFSIRATYRQGNLTQLNQILTHEGLAGLGDNNLWLDLTSLHMRHNWIFEDGIGLTPTTKSTNNGMEALYNQFHLYLRVGYNVVPKAQFRLFPFVGANLSDALLRIHDNNYGNNDFAQSLMGGSRSRSYNQWRFGIDLGAGFDYSIPAKPKHYDYFTVERNVPIGVRVGYHIQTSDSNWYLDDYKLTNGPDNKQNAVFVSVNIGLGYVLRKRNSTDY